MGFAVVYVVADLARPEQAGFTGWRVVPVPVLVFCMSFDIAEDGSDWPPGQKTQEPAGRRIHGAGLATTVVVVTVVGIGPQRAGMAMARPVSLEALRARPL